MLKNNKKAWSTSMEEVIRKLNWSYGDFIQETQKYQPQSKTLKAIAQDEKFQFSDQLETVTPANK